MSMQEVICVMRGVPVSTMVVGGYECCVQMKFTGARVGLSNRVPGTARQAIRLAVEPDTSPKRKRETHNTVPRLRFGLA
jgi:hypothetical protein